MWRWTKPQGLRSFRGESFLYFSACATFHNLCACFPSVWWRGFCHSHGVKLWQGVDVPQKGNGFLIIPVRLQGIIYRTDFALRCIAWLHPRPMLCCVQTGKLLHTPLIPGSIHKYSWLRILHNDINLGIYCWGILPCYSHLLPWHLIPSSILSGDIFTQKLLGQWAHRLSLKSNFIGQLEIHSTQNP